MGWNPGQRTKEYGATEDWSWLGKAHGTDDCDTVTLAGDLFLDAFPDGVVPSGVVIARLDAGLKEGMYGPYADDGADGLDTARYHLFNTVDLKGTTAETVRDTVAPGFWHGQVIEAKLPANHGLTAAAKADLAHIEYV